MGNCFRRRNDQTTEADDAIHGAVHKVDEAAIHPPQTEGENLIIKMWVYLFILKYTRILTQKEVLWISKDQSEK